MWTPEEIDDMNPPGPGQHRSFLAHIYDIVAATPSDLATWSEQLENEAGPHVLAACQLPFQIALGVEPIRIAGWRKGSTVELRFSKKSAVIDHPGHMLPASDGDSGSTTSAGGLHDTHFTQVTGIIRLWTRRASLHTKYANCLTSSGLRNETIGRVGDWMESEEAHHRGRYAPISAEAFEGQVARRVRTELHAAINSFLAAYSAGTLTELRRPDRLHGYFIMIAPGRVACASPPLPIIGALAARGQRIGSEAPSAGKLRTLLERPIRLDDRVLRQLMAMRRVLEAGEPELALVGCVATIEWFLNASLSPSLRAHSRRKKGSISITELREIGGLEFLPREHVEQLLQAARKRNEAVHGPPPSRPSVRHQTALHSDDVNQVLDLALRTYRESNLVRT